MKSVKQMGRFLLESFIFVCISFTMFMIFILYEHKRIIKTDDYCVAFYDKCEMLNVKNITNDKRIILLGGSNVAFGVDSKLLADSTNSKIVNYGLHASIGLDVPMRTLDKSIKTGDMVICMPEYEMFIGKGFEGTKLASEILIINPSSLLNMRLGQYYHFFKFLKSAVKEIDTVAQSENENCDEVCPNQDKIYCRDAFNYYGDVVTHLGKSTCIHNLYEFKDEFNETYYQIFLKTIVNWKERGVEVVVLPPCIEKEQYELNRTEINYMLKRFEHDITDYPKNVCNSIFEGDMMFDTYYHLNDSGRHFNTLRILNAINKSHLKILHD